MSLTAYDVAILRAVLDGCDTVGGLVYLAGLPGSTVRRRVRSLVGRCFLIRHPDTGALVVTLGGREALDRAERGGAA